MRETLVGLMQFNLNNLEANLVNESTFWKKTDKMEIQISITFDGDKSKKRYTKHIKTKRVGESSKSYPRGPVASTNSSKDQPSGKKEDHRITVDTFDSKSRATQYRESLVEGLSDRPRAIQVPMLSTYRTAQSKASLIPSPPASQEVSQLESQKLPAVRIHFQIS